MTTTSGLRTKKAASRIVRQHQPRGQSVRPNWCCANDYRSLAAVGLDRIALEFVLRNNEFKAKYLAADARGQRDVRREYGIDPVLPIFFKPPYCAALVSSVSGDVFVASDLRNACGQVVGNRDRLAALVFDLGHSLPKQLRAADTMLKRAVAFAKARGVRPVPNAQRARRKGVDYVAMLRVLDARAADAKYQQIADTLYPQREGALELVKKLAKQARALSAGGYRDLLVLEM